MRLMSNYFDHLSSLDTPTQIAEHVEPNTVLWVFHTIQPSSLSFAEIFSVRKLESPGYRVTLIA